MKITLCSSIAFQDEVLSIKEKLEKIRYVLKRGCPFGKESWIKITAIKLGLIPTLNPIGRPRKGT